MIVSLLAVLLGIGLAVALWDRHRRITAAAVALAEAVEQQDYWRHEFDSAVAHAADVTASLDTALARVAEHETTRTGGAPSDVPAELQAQIAGWIQEQETRWPERSGEAKRHQVYAAAVKAAPTVSKRAISQAIEGAL